MSIPFIDLKKQFANMEKDIRAGIDGVLAHGRFIMGPEVDELETRLAEYVGTKYALSCSSGTDALLMPLMLFGVGPGDAVFTSPFTFIATAEVISLLGATPVFVDIDPKTYNLDVERLREAVERVEEEGDLRPAGIIPVDLFGLPADYDPIMALAEEKNLFVLEDAAQGFGGVYHGRRAGSLGHVGATSFFPAKPLGAYGDGGAIFTDDHDMLEKLRSVRVHGQGSNKYDNVRVGCERPVGHYSGGRALGQTGGFPQGDGGTAAGGPTLQPGSVRPRGHAHCSRRPFELLGPVFGAGRRSRAGHEALESGRHTHCGLLSQTTASARGFRRAGS